MYKYKGIVDVFGKYLSVNRHLAMSDDKGDAKFPVLYIYISEGLFLSDFWMVGDA